MAVAMGGAYPVAERTRGCRWPSRTYRPAEDPRAVTGQPGVVCVCVWASVPRECVLRPYLLLCGGRTCRKARPRPQAPPPPASRETAARGEGASRGRGASSPRDSR